MAVLLLDVMDTLVRDPFFAAIPGYFGLSLHDLVAQTHRGAWVDFECGRIDEATFASRFFIDGRTIDMAGLRACLYASYAFLPSVEPLLRDLRAAGVAMHALSNYPIWYQLIEERIHLSGYVAWSFVSCRTGLRKPSPEAFFHASRSLGVAPHECIFVDDIEANVEAARAMGMIGIVFRDAITLRADLRSYGMAV